MSQEDRDKYIKPKDFYDDGHNKAVLKAEGRGHELLDAEEISLEILRKIQDKKYEIDIEYEQTRDLYEK